MDAIATGTRSTRDGPWCWQSKTARRLIRERFGQDPSLGLVLAIYDALTEIASDQGTEEPTTTHAWISHISGFSIPTIKRRMDELEKEGFVRTVRNTAGGKGPSTYHLLAICDNGAVAADGHSAPIGNPEPIAHCEPSTPIALGVNKVERSPSEEIEKNVEERKKKGEPSSPPAQQSKKKGPKPPVTDEDWLNELAADPVNQGLDVRAELARCQFWCKGHMKQCTRRRFEAWLLRADRPLALQATDQSSIRTELATVTKQLASMKDFQGMIRVDQQDKYRALCARKAELERTL